MLTEKDLVRVAKRENNNKRKYLVVNCLQAKHVPAEPTKTFAMFDELADRIGREYSNERLLLVGFAETATAIGARLAVRLNSLYMQTTRENIEGAEYLYFTESHSHATEQKLIKTDLDKIIRDIDRIIFVEDEVTTGNTIMKIIDIIRNTYGNIIDFSVASLLNGMDEKARDRYEANNIRIHYIVKTDHSGYTEIAEGFKGDGTYITDLDKRPKTDFKLFCAKKYVNGRRLLKGADYERACKELWEQIIKFDDFTGCETILVLGTEEFMYPAVYVAHKFCENGCDAKSHSTTRSPIIVSAESNYPLHCRYELRSFYDEGRKTYIYDVGKYDKVIVITDAVCTSDAGMNDLCNAIAQNNNTDISVVRWCEK